MGSLSTRDRLLALARRRTKAVELDGETFHVREPMAADTDAFIKRQSEDAIDAMAGLFAECIIDPETGEPILSVEDATTVAKMPRVAHPLVAAISSLVEPQGEKKTG